MNDTWKDRFVKRELILAEKLAKRFNPKNFRLHPENQKAITEASLDQIGWFDEVSLSTNGDGPADLDTNPDAVMTDGHLRVTLALVKNPQMLIPCKWYQLTPTETKQMLAAKDSITTMADMDFEVLGALLQDVPSFGVEWDVWVGDAFADWEPEPITNGGVGSEPQVTQTEAEKYQEIWQVRVGDIWQLGRHKIACVDSLSKDSVQKVTGDLVVNFVWADPPYGINIVAANESVGGGEAYDIPFGGVKPKGYVGGGVQGTKTKQDDTRFKIGVKKKKTAWNLGRFQAVWKQQAHYWLRRSQ